LAVDVAKGGLTASKSLSLALVWNEEQMG
jgi:hypothetical protein